MLRRTFISRRLPRIVYDTAASAAAVALATPSASALIDPRAFGDVVLPVLQPTPLLHLCGHDKRLCSLLSKEYCGGVQTVTPELESLLAPYTPAQLATMTAVSRKLIMVESLRRAQLERVTAAAQRLQQAEYHLGHAFMWQREALVLKRGRNLLLQLRGLQRSD